MTYVSTADQITMRHAMARAGRLTDTMPTTVEQDAVFWPMHAAAMRDAAVYTFARDTSDAWTVSLGQGVYRAGRTWVAYMVEWSATGEIYSGLDFVRDMHDEKATESAAVALLAELGRVIGDTALVEFAGRLAA